MRQGLAQVTFPQKLDIVGDIERHVLGPDAPCHAQLFEPRLLMEHLPLQLLQLRHHVGNGDGAVVPLLLTRARAMGGSYNIIIFFDFFFYRGCGGKVFFFAFFC